MAVFNTNVADEFFTDEFVYQTLINDGADLIAAIALNPTFPSVTFGTELPPTSLTSTLAQGLTSTGASYTYTGTNLQPWFIAVAGSGSIKTIHYQDAASDLLLTGPINFSATAATITGLTGGFTKVQYDSAGFDLNFVGNWPLTSFTTTVKQIDVLDTVNDTELHVTGSFAITFNSSGTAVTSVTGTVTSFSMEEDGQYITVSGLSLPASTFLNDSLTTLQTMFGGADTLTADAAGVALTGYNGNDTYIFNVGAGPDDGPWVHEEGFLAASGIDTVKTAFDYTLDANVENGLLLAGGTSLTGNHLVNTLTGNTGDNTLDGMRGKDILVGSGGNDTFVVDLQKVGSVVSLEDTVTEALNSGTDTLIVRASAQDSITFAIEGQPELTFTRIADASSPIVGSWYSAPASPDERGGVITFFSDGTYVLAGDSGVDTGTERGTYTWDAETGAFTVDVLVDTNGDAGLSGAPQVETIEISGNTMTLTDTDTGSQTLTKVTSSTIPLLGGWSIADGEALTTVTFLANGEYFMTQDPSSGLGIEHATYLWTPVNGGFQVTNIFLSLGSDGLAIPHIDSMTMNLGVPESSTATVLLPANVENLDLSLAGDTDLKGTGNGLDNILTGSAGNNVLDGGLGNDTYVGSDGNDTYLFSQAGDVHSGTDNGIDTAKVSATGNPAYLNLSDKPELENVIFTGTAAVTLIGNASDNSLTGGAGNDNLDGGLGNDVMAGGAGNDTYTVDRIGDVVNDSAGTGDTVIANVNDYTIGTGVENLTLGDDESIVSGSGNALANLLTANANAPVLRGGLGNDTYVFLASLGSAQEESGAGIDLVKTAFDYELEENIENAAVLGGAGRELGGNDLANLLTGSTGDDVLIGAGGKDTMVGGAGNDTYHVNLVKPATTVMFEDTITDTAGTGDTLVVHADGGLTLSTPTFLITLAATLENLDLADTNALALNVTGNASANDILGNAGDNKLDGGSGNDTIAGGTGNDTLLGGAGDDRLDGDAGNDSMDGGLGNDTFGESFGDDTFILSQAGDAIDVADDDGIDTVKVGATGNNAYLNLSDKGWLENVIFTGTAGVTITGNGAENSLQGAGGADSIDGGAGNDAMNGGAGNDTYRVDSLTDSITDSAGIDTVIADVDGYTLDNGLENLTLGNDVSIVSGTGNALANVLTANGNEPILYGGAGNDTFVFEQSLGNAAESMGGGTDLVKTAFDYELNSNIENAMVLGTAGVALTGNELANILTGNTGDDVLIGGGGKDVLIGGAGNDTYHVNLVKPATTVMLEDTVTDTAGTGDTLVVHADGGLTLSTPTFLITLAATLENIDIVDTGTLALNVTGNASNNVITGNAGHNKLDGGAGNDEISGGDGNDTVLGGAGNDRLDGDGGNDSMDGGLGNDTMGESFGDDTFVISEAGDSIDVADDQGTDTVRVGALGNAAYLDLSDKAWLENVVYTGTVGKAITGNTAVNSLTGGAGADSINGGAGADVMIGMGGNDTYYVDNVGDSITDSAGIDTVIASISHALGGGLENLTLAAGAGGIDATGNTLANKIVGNEGDNVLRGGGGGLDTMTGGAGADTFVFDRAVAGVATITDFTHGEDHIGLDVGAVPGFASLFTGGVFNADDLVLGTAANAVGAQLIYTQSTGALYYDADGTGAMAKVQIATLTTHPTLDADDFVPVGVS